MLALIFTLTCVTRVLEIGNNQTQALVAETRSPWSPLPPEGRVTGRITPKSAADEIWALPPGHSGRRKHARQTTIDGKNLTGNVFAGIAGEENGRPFQIILVANTT